MTCPHGWKLFALGVTMSPGLVACGPGVSPQAAEKLQTSPELSAQEHSLDHAAENDSDRDCYTPQENVYCVKDLDFPAFS